MENNLIKTHFRYYNKCNQMEADEVQELTHWDETSSNEYAIQDEYYNNGIYIIPIETFLKCTDGEYRPPFKQIDYCAYNEKANVIFCLTKKDIHYFYY